MSSIAPIATIMHSPVRENNRMQTLPALMALRMIALAIGLTAPATAHAGAAFAPRGHVKIITQQGPGGGTMAAMQVLADELGHLWRQRVVLVNRPGAGGEIAARDVASAEPDGRTLFLALASAFVVLPVSKPDFAPTVDTFVPVGFVGEVPMGIAVSPTLPVRSLEALIEFANRSPTGLNVAVAFKGSLPELATELLRARSGAKLTVVHYPGSAQALGDVVSGRVPVIVEGIGGPIGAGQLRLLAIAAEKRAQKYPNIPTVAETLPGFAASGWFILVAPAKTPENVAEAINADLRLVLSNPEMKSRLEAVGTFTRSLSIPDLREFIRTQEALWRPVVQRLNASDH
jgi:tripartite-type tricarboxylate transporter receptor subunit TctC